MELQNRIGAWGDTAFPAATPESVHNHLTDEVDELGWGVIHEQRYSIIEEAADCAMLLFQLAHKCGFDLLAAVEEKLEVNKARKWGKPDARGVVRHIEPEFEVRTMDIRNGHAEDVTGDDR